MKKLRSVKFMQPTVASGQIVDIEFKWRSTEDGTVLPHFDGQEFDLDPEQFELPARPDGDTVRRGVQITRTGTAPPDHCDVRFEFGFGDPLASIKVT